MIVGTLSEVTIVDVLHRGVANQECIAVFVETAVNLGQYGIMVGYRASNQHGALPYTDNLFWFGDGVVESGDWILIYTGTGESTKSRSKDDSGNIYALHWGRRTTMFANTSIVPILFRIDAVSVGKSPTDVAQLPRVSGAVSS